MFGRIFVKEWREKKLVLGLAGLLLLIFAVVALAGRGKFDPNIAGLFAMFFPTFCGLLLGSAAFQSELKNDSWTYLFSRPVKKGTIWLHKYLALLSLLALIVLVALLVRAVVPGLNQYLSKLGAPADFSNDSNLYSSLLINILLPIFALSLTYALSMFTDNPFIIIMMSLTISLVLLILYTPYLEFLWTTYAYSGAHGTSFFSRGAPFLSAIMLLMIAAAFLAASWRTFSKVDFSQQAKKILSFSKLVIPLLILAFGIGMVVAARGNIFSTKQTLDLFSSSKIRGQAYFVTWTGKVYRYDESLDRIIRIKGFNQDLLHIHAPAGGEKIAYIKQNQTESGYRNWGTEICIANLDGTQEKSLVRFEGEDSPFSGWRPESNCLLSPDGRQVAFIASPPPQSREERGLKLFWMNVDGTGQKSRPVAINLERTANLISWLSGENSIVFHLHDRDSYRLNLTFVKLNLDTGSAETLEIDADYLYSDYWIDKSTVSPDGTAMIKSRQDQDQNMVKVEILDLRTFEAKEIFAAPHIPYSLFFGLTWTRDSGKFAYFYQGALWVYSRGRGISKEVRRDASKKIGLGFDWLADDKRLAVLEGNEKESFITILSEDFKEEKKVKMPEMIRPSPYGLGIWALNNKIIVASGGEPGAWRLDLATDQWKKIY